MPPSPRAVRAIVALLPVAVLAGCGSQAPEPDPTARARAADPLVVAISIDGLSSQALTALGRTGAPEIHRMMRQGASTLNARTEVEQTETLPNHTGMVTGRRIDAAYGGHGVTWNDERLTPATVQQAAGEGVDSIFAMAHREGLDSALYSAKVKFSLFERSWPAGVDKAVITDARNARVVRAARTDLRGAAYDFSFLHISLPDIAGHARGWMSPAYLDAVRGSDRLVGGVLDVIRDTARLRGRVTVILTADHGGPVNELRHRDPTVLANYRVPFVVWGPGVARGADLYDLSPRLADPGDARVGYDGEQPVRNGFVANTAAEVLGVPVVRESELNADSELNWTATSSR